MKALTLWQPWASLIFYGKKIETRSRLTHYRGLIAIHAANTLSKSAKIWTEATPEITAAISVPVEELPVGAVIGTVEIVDCYEIHGASMPGSSSKDVFIEKYNPNDPNGVTWISSEEYAFGDFTPGRYAYILENPQMLAEPIPARGQQGLWNWTPPEGGLQYADSAKPEK